MTPTMAPAVSDAVLMTLAGIAYGEPASIANYLNMAEPTKGDWSLAWLADPPNPPVNFAFLAKSARSGNYVLAIRGTYPDPFSSAYWDDGDEDSPFGEMVGWPGASGARISAGTATGLGNLFELVDQGGVSLQAAIESLPAAAVLTVTGHSLGGTLAPVVALKFAEIYPDRRIEATSFAGMTPGDQGFADLFAPGTRLEGKVRRVFNTLDTVSYGWNKVFATHDFYQPAPQGGPVVAAMLLATAARLDLGGYGYQPVGAPIPLTGVVQPFTIGCEFVAYVLENLHQHMPDTYLQLLGAPPLPFSILFGNIVAPRELVAATTSAFPRLPVIYAKV